MPLIHTKYDPTRQLSEKAKAWKALAASAEPAVAGNLERFALVPSLRAALLEACDEVYRLEGKLAAHEERLEECEGALYAIRSAVDDAMPIEDDPNEQDARNG